VRVFKRQEPNGAGIPSGTPARRRPAGDWGRWTRRDDRLVGGGGRDLLYGSVDEFILY